MAWEPGKPLSIEVVDVMPPRDGEVLVRIVASGVCHTDAFTLSGEDPEGNWPAILGHEGGGIVEQVGEGGMPDGASRFYLGGNPIHHYMGCSTFSEYTVLPEISLARVNKAAPLEEVCLLGCGVTKGRKHSQRDSLLRRCYDIAATQ